MRSLALFVWLVVLALSICLLVESESRIRQFETLHETNELCQGAESDGDLQSGLKEWRNQRTETIKTLKDLRDKLDMLIVSANYGKGAGNGVQLIGTVTSIVGSFLELAGLPDFSSVMGIGDLIYHSGSLVDGMSSIAESLGSAKYLNDLENILKKDKELSVSLGDRLEAWKSLDEKIQEIFGFEETSEKRIQLLNFLGEFSRIRSITNDFKDTVDALKSGKYSTYIETEMRNDRFLKLSNYLEKNPQIPNEVRMGLIGYNRVSNLVKSYKNFVGKEISEKVAPIPQEYKSPTADTVAKYTFLRSIDIAEKYLSLLNVSKVIKEGKSKYSDSLKEIIDILELELKNLELL
ncbi:unnamed protein product [Larinioides sclopetarius]|uniref:Uncharacterized protein n=1 Tax=Larinioides sclopetarius TaxID=280406 RepID=A0AAV2BK31_9ARAC